jgi:hypothetical protein
LIAEHPQPVPCQSVRCEERVARKQCSNRRPLRCVQRAALHWDVSYVMLRRKAWCESRFDPGATNGAHVGVFQFAWPTWGTTPYAQRSPWMAKWNALAAGWMHAVGRGAEWACR